ncbi:MAG: V-type ATP synthase subunit I [Rectinemataceae bacterium]
MIARMRKLDILVFHKDRDALLSELQTLGAVHVEEKSESTSRDVAVVAEELKKYEQVLLGQELRAKAVKKIPAPDSKKTAEAVAESFLGLDRERQRLEQAIASQKMDEELLGAWGDIDPGLMTRLEAAGVKARYFEVPVRSFEQVHAGNPDLVETGRSKLTVRCALFERGPARDVEGADEVKLPRKSLDDIHADLGIMDRELTEANTELDRLLPYMPDVAAWVSGLKARIGFETARLCFSEAGTEKLLHLEGWIPSNREKDVKAGIASFNATALFADPAPAEVPPVLMQNGRYARLFEPITKIFSIPDYFELDPTPFFAPFFMLFVGLCLGDLAYGSIIFIGSIVALFLAPKSLKPFAGLGAVLGASVMVCGILLNSAFGGAIFGGPGIPAGTSLFSSGADKFSLLAALEKDGGTFYPMMGLSLLIGIIQIQIGLVLCAVNRARQGNWGGAIRPIADMMLILGAITVATHTNAFDLKLATFEAFGIPVGKLPLLIPLVVAQGMVYGGAVLFLFFDAWGTPFTKKIGWSFFNLYLFISGSLGNMLSYMRLFALGLSGGMLGMVFNTLAFGLITKDGVVNPFTPAIIGTVLLLVMGHSLNFGLSLLGSFVHPLRLTFLEFFSTLDFKGNGKPFKPLSRAGEV